MMLYKNNVACIAQVEWWHIKGNWTKHISLKFFYTYELQKESYIDRQQIYSSETDLFSKTLYTSTFEKLVHNVMP